MKTIPLTQGHEAIVDDELYDHLSLFKWHALVHKARGKTYIYGARWGKYNSRRRSIRLHHQVLGILTWELDGTGKLVDHKNRNTLDNRKDNLRVTNKSINAINSGRSDQAVGVYFERSRNRYKAFILHPYKRREYLGTFRTEAEAIRVREEVLRARNS